MRTAFVAIILAIAAAPATLAASGEGPHVRLEVDNSGDDATLRVRLEDAGSTLYDETIVVDGGSSADIVIDAPMGAYSIGVSRLDEPPAGIPDPLDRFDDWSIATGFDSTGCPTAYAFVMTLGFGEERFDDSGCTTFTRETQAILDAARATGGRGASIDIPAPGSADRGVFGPDEVPFEWRAATFQDEYGRAVDGFEVAYLGYGGRSWAGNALGSATVEAERTTEVFRYLPGEHETLSWSGLAGLAASASATEASASLMREIRYGPSDSPMACFLRSPLQGASISPGATLASEDVCPALPGPAWRVGSPIEHRGLDALPLYRINETDEGIELTRILFVDGLAYPLDVRYAELPKGGLLYEWVLTLDRYQPGGEPLPSDPIERAPPPELAPLDALRGPAGGAFEMTLADAVDAAMLLPRVRLLTTDAGAALLAARYHETEAASNAFPTWDIVFGARGADPVYARCVLAGAAPACRELTEAPHHELADAPRMGARDLPARAASFDDVLARRADEAPTYALYRAWEPAILSAGTRDPDALVETPFDPDADEGAYTTLELPTARTLWHVEVIGATSGFDPAGLALVEPKRLSASDARSWASAEALPYVVGGGAGLALLALLAFLLYSRLVRSRVLDDATRAAILDIVTAQPGLHASGILQELDKKSGVGEYHLDVLVREGFLTSLATPGFRRYFVTGKHMPEEMRDIAATREGQNERLLRIIRANPGIPLQTLALEAGVSVPYASRGVQRLAEAGLVNKVVVGRALTLHPAQS